MTSSIQEKPTKENETSKASLKDLLIAMTLFAFLGMILVLGASLAVKNIFFKNSETKIVDDSKLSCPPTYDGFKSISQGQILSLIDTKTPAYASNGDFVNSTIIVSKRNTTSEVVCGYLYVKTGTESFGRLRDWENVYVNPNKFGGHLITGDALYQSDEESYTESLFSLEDITYRPIRDSNEIRSANWAALMNVSDIIEFNIALNTEDRTGYIEEISLAYRCYDFETKKESQDCKFNVLERRGL